MLFLVQGLLLLTLLFSTASGEDFDVIFDIQIDELTSGTFKMAIFEDWAPLGAERFRELVQAKYFDGARFFRVLDNFMAQFGIAGDPEMTKKWRKPIKDDPQKKSNEPGTLSFATSGPNTRSAQLFVNLVHNKYLDKDFQPIGKVVEGMDVVNQIYKGDREKPDQGRYNNEGNAYVTKHFPKLSYIKTVRFAAATEGPKRTKHTEAVVKELLERKVKKKINKIKPIKSIQLNSSKKSNNGMEYIYYFLGIGSILALIVYYLRREKIQGKAS